MTGAKNFIACRVVLGTDVTSSPTRLGTRHVINARLEAAVDRTTYFLKVLGNIISSFAPITTSKVNLVASLRNSGSRPLKIEGQEAAESVDFSGETTCNFKLR